MLIAGLLQSCVAHAAVCAVQNYELSRHISCWPKIRLIIGKSLCAGDGQSCGHISGWQHGAL